MSRNRGDVVTRRMRSYVLLVLFPRNVTLTLSLAAFNITQYNTTAVNTTVTLNNFTLETTEGFCSGEKGVFSCSKKVLVPSYFQADLNSSSLVFNATGDFYAPMVPVIPWMKLPVLTTFKLGNVNVTLSYSAAPEVPPVV